MLTSKQVADRLNCKPSTVYAWAKAEQIPSYKVGGLLRFDLDEIEEWIMNSKTRLEASTKVIPEKLGSTEVDDLVRRAIVSATNPSYNSSKGKLGLDKAHKKGGNNGTL